MRKPLTEYTSEEHEGWDRMPVELAMPRPGDEPYTGTWLRRDGIQFIATVKDYGAIQLIHASVCPMYTLRPDMRREDLEEYIAMQTPAILREFFGERQFARQPDDPRVPVIKHYFSTI